MQELSLATELKYIAASAVSAFATALGVAALIVATTRRHIRFTRDRRPGGPQHLHDGPVPRIGGIAIVAGFAAGLVHLVWFGAVPPTVSASTAMLLLAVLAIVAGCGLAEDLTGRVRPAQRLAWMAFGASLLVVSRHLELDRLGVPVLDLLISFWPLAVAFTVFACVGATNAYNIVDGLNGLLAGVSLITLAVIAWVAASVGDKKVFALAVLLGTATLGWLPYNWPRARLFAGDGGAYAIGFLTAVLLLLLVDRNPEVSPWFGITAAALPVWETLYSMWRRARQGLSTMEADRSHLHQLVQRRVQGAIERRVRRVPGAAAGPHDYPPNSLCSPILWVLHAVVAVGGAAFHADTGAQVSLVVAFGLAYVLAHRALTRAQARSAPALRA